jgi:putative nucleotidyltransferase with HDIG domain
MARVGTPLARAQAARLALSAPLQEALRITLLRVYALSLAAAAAVFCGVLIWLGDRLDHWPTIAVLAAAGMLAERGSVRITAKSEISLALIPSVVAGLLLGPLAAMLVGAASNLGDLGRGADKRLLKWVTYTSSRAVGAGLGGITAAQARDAVASEVGGLALAAILTVATLELVDLTFSVTTAVARRNGDIGAVVRTLGPPASVAALLFPPIVALMVGAYEHISPWSLPLFLVPSLAAQRLFVLYQQQKQLTDDLVGANDRLERASMSFAIALVATIEARDRYTAGHSAAVAIYARDIAARMGRSEEEQRLAHLCGLVHDVGKIGLPPGLLEKPGALTLDERREMERHSEIGERILRNVEDYAEIAAIVRHHHERWDGEGYPDGLFSDEIPLLSRIIAVADAYNAMTSDRPYRDAMPSRVARLRLAQAADSQFDTGVVAAFEAVLAGANESYRTGQRGDFILGSGDAAEDRAAVA